MFIKILVISLFKGVLINYRSEAVAKELLGTVFGGKPFW